MKFSSNEKTITFMAASIAAIILCYMFIYAPQNKERKKLFIKISYLLKKNAKARKAIENMPNPGEKKEILEKEERLLRQQAPSMEPSQLVNRIYAELEQRRPKDVDIISAPILITENKNVTGKIQKHFVRIKLQCEYRSLIEVLGIINSLPMKVTIEDLDIVGEGKNLPRLTVKLELAIYVTKG
jgi:hypothetical protein